MCADERRGPEICGECFLQGRGDRKVLLDAQGRGRRVCAHLPGRSPFPSAAAHVAHMSSNQTHFVLPRKAVNSSEFSLYVCHYIMSIFHIVKMI